MSDTPGIRHSYHHSCGCLWHTTLDLTPEQRAWLAARPCPHHYDPERARREADAEYRRAEAEYQRGRWQRLGAVGL